MILRRPGRRCKQYLKAAVALGTLALVFRSLSATERLWGHRKSAHRLHMLRAVKEHDNQACIHPVLDPFDPDIMQFFRKLPPVDCGPDKDWTHVTEGKFRISQEAVRHHGDITCSATPILFKDDFSFQTGAKVEVKDGDPIPSDFLQVGCTSTSGKQYSNHHAAVSSALELQNGHRTKASDSLGLSIFMLGIDSVSKMAWLRALPKTRDYFVNTLGGLELDGYNIVGDGTPAALLPILTGQTEEELPEARRGHEGAKPVDGHPWIWKEFRDQGYVTMWAEDMPVIGTFHYRMLGFESPPVDHYMRTFYLSAQDTYTRSKYLCLGSLPRHQVFFNWFDHGFSMYKGKRTFMLGFNSELGHGDSSMLQIADESLLHFIKALQVSGALENTLLILMSDHGSRFSNIRAKVQGKLEERMPYFSFRFPPWFESKYPDAMRNFRTNLQRLTTPFDIHATLKDVLHFSGAGVGNVSSRGISLFKEVPKERTCADASVAPHWCGCLAWETVDQNDPVVKMVAGTAVAAMNKWTQSVRDRCAELSLSKVVSAGKLKPQRDVLRFKETIDVDGRVADLSGDTKVDVVLYQLTILTDPNGGRYEVTLNYDTDSKEATLDPADVSRTNKYGSAPDCVARKLPHLRPYCFCSQPSGPNQHAEPHAFS